MPNRNGSGRRLLKLHLGPRNPLKPRAQISDLTQKRHISGPAGGFQKPHSLETHSFAISNCRARRIKNRSKGGTLDRIFSCGRSIGGPKTPATTGLLHLGGFGDAVSAFKSWLLIRVGPVVSSKCELWPSFEAEIDRREPKLSTPRPQTSAIVEGVRLLPK